ncbi:hypothetical protein [Spirilliplanes yamanashiensis]|uniref:Uncharacterized protein n=1 Tax=Spirilliplanes yamanashiensis TaxID=42233 RepID=A0A8J4DKV4_9ACTN|nr:hypothetical protein [Spirilliplanes yamanashiensis]MDP9817630.1 hypothetical protein [Spirilliplanes yamanashiensis]GIJ04440.1 hypothetical protein Sya03_37920 [Spirilliplanes yamanashiensis]
MTLQIPALHHEALDERLAARIEQRLMALADELEHADVVAYGSDRGLATRGGVVRMTIADMAAVAAEAAAEAALEATATIVRIPVAPVPARPDDF